MKDILFASGNKHKIGEINQILKDYYRVLCPADFNFFDDIPETGQTLHENAFIKASYIFGKFSIPCFADDTGLEIDALNGAPGVYSARFAGEGVTYKQNRDKVIALMAGKENNKARFKTVIALISTAGVFYFEGAVEGIIISDERGEGGFGYDPIFIPDGYTQTFAEMPAALKNSISHRAVAVGKLTHFLKERPL